MLCTISGVFRTPNGEVHPGATVKFRRSAGVHSYVDTDGPVTIIPDEMEMITDEVGTGTVDLYPGRYQVELLGSNGSMYRFLVNVPSETSILFPALLSRAADYGDGNQLATIAGYAASALESRELSSEAAAYIESRTAAIDAAGAAAISVPPLATQAAEDALTASTAATTATTKAAEADASADAAAASALSAAEKDASMIGWAGAWVTGIAYIPSDITSKDGSAYICLLSHTSDVFETDLSGGNWELFVSKGAAGDMKYVENLEFLTDVGAARNNLGLGSAAKQNTGAFATAAQGAKADTALQPTDISDQSTAEAGTDNTKVMTPLTTAQAIAARTPPAESVPAGAVCHFAQETAPTGWLKANGAVISRITYASLFAAIGTTFGAGDGTTTFALPDLRGEFIRGWDDARGIDSGRAFGSAQADEFKAHTHTTHTHGSASNGAQASSAKSTPSGGTIASGSKGGAETRPRNVALLACIKY